MNVPEALKIDTYMAVVFKKHGRMNGVPFNAVYQQEDGSLMFFDTDSYHTSGMVRVAYKDIEGDLDENTRS